VKRLVIDLAALGFNAEEAMMICEGGSVLDYLDEFVPADAPEFRGVNPKLVFEIPDAEWKSFDGVVREALSNGNALASDAMLALDTQSKIIIELMFELGDIRDSIRDAANFAARADLPKYNPNAV
jgi:hypothetical protein